MTHRIISGLGYAEEAESPFKGKPRGRGAKAQGLRFERALAKALVPAGWRAGQWFRFNDLFGRGYAQTDLLYVAPAGVYVIEAKLGNIAAGEAQFRELYKPLVEYVYKRPAYGIIAARYLSARPAQAIRITTSLREAVERSRSGPVVLQWREGYPLDAPPAQAMRTGT